MKCVICLKEAEVMFDGNSLCPPHWVSLSKIITGDITGKTLAQMLKESTKK